MTNSSQVGEDRARDERERLEARGDPWVHGYEFGRATLRAELELECARLRAENAQLIAQLAAANGNVAELMERLDA